MTSVKLILHLKRICDGLLYDVIKNYNFKLSHINLENKSSSFSSSRIKYYSSALEFIKGCMIKVIKEDEEDKYTLPETVFLFVY